MHFFNPIVTRQAPLALLQDILRDLPDPASAFSAHFANVLRLEGADR
jgi:hypothetical protein